MTVESQASESKDLQTVLARMPWLHTVIYIGPQAGETHHDPWAQHGPLWLHLYSESYEQDLNGRHHDDIEDGDYESYEYTVLNNRISYIL